MSFDMAAELAVGELIRSRWWSGFAFGLATGLVLGLALAYGLG
jgi:hypothetical protein